MKNKQFYNYTIYENGDVINSHGKLIKKREHNGIISIKLVTVNGKRKNYTMARLLYWLFIKEFDINNNNLCVTYKDNNKSNIQLSNLQLIERKNLIQGEKHRNVVKLTNSQIEEIKKLYNGGCKNQFDKKGKYSLQDLADKFNVSKKEIHFIVTNKTRNKDNYKLK